jgi:hypothetical protein
MNKKQRTALFFCLRLSKPKVFVPSKSGVFGSASVFAIVTQRVYLLAPAAILRFIAVNHYESKH